MRKRNTNNLTFDIVHQLGDEIVTGKYSDNRPFPTEATLCEEYDVSRSVMREAVKMITSKGMLTARPRRGTEVTDESQWNLLDPDVLTWLLKRDVSLPLMIEFTEARMGIEPEAATLAAQNATEEQKQAILGALGQMEKAKRGESDPLESDIAFHLAVLNASNNKFLIQLDGLIETALRFSIRMTNRLKGVQVASVEDHRVVADAIMAGDKAKAADGMEYMLLEALKLFNENQAAAE